MTTKRTDLAGLYLAGRMTELDYMTPEAQASAWALERELVLDARAGVSLIGRLAMTAASAPATALEQIEAEALQTAADLRDGLAYRIERENTHATDWSY